MRETISLSAKSDPARSSRWLSESGTSIIVERMAGLLSSTGRDSCAVAAAALARSGERFVFGLEHRQHDERVEAGAVANAVAQHAFLDEAFAAVERERARVGAADVEPEAMRAEVAEGHLCEQA